MLRVMLPVVIFTSLSVIYQGYCTTKLSHQVVSLPVSKTNIVHYAVT